MTAEAGDRLRAGVLAGFALVALSVGGWGWRAAAPATGPVPAATPTTQVVPVPGDQVRSRVLIDPENGRVIERTGGTDPDEPLVLHEEAGEAGFDVSHVVWRERSHLAEGDSPLLRQSSPSDGDRHLLLVDCAGSGALRVGYSGSRGDGSQELTCPGPPTTIPLTSAGGPLRVWFDPTEGAVDLDARLTALF